MHDNKYIWIDIFVLIRRVLCSNFLSKAVFLHYYYLIFIYEFILQCFAGYEEKN